MMRFNFKKLFGEGEVTLCAQGHTTLKRGDIISIKGVRYITL